MCFCPVRFLIGLGPPTNRKAANLLPNDNNIEWDLTAAVGNIQRDLTGAGNARREALVAMLLPQSSLPLYIALNASTAERVKQQSLVCPSVCAIFFYR